MSMSQVFGAPAWGLNAGHLSKHGGGCSSGGSPFGDHYNSMTPSKQVGSADIFGSSGGGSKSAWNHESIFGGGGGNKDTNKNKGNNKNDRNSSPFSGGPDQSALGSGGAVVASANPWGDVYKSRQHFNDMHFC